MTEPAIDLDAGALEKALADTPKNDRYPKIQAIRAYLAARPATGTECKHEPFEGRCVHCDVEFKNGLPATGAGEWRQAERKRCAEMVRNMIPEIMDTADRNLVQTRLHQSSRAIAEMIADRLEQEVQ